MGKLEKIGCYTFFILFVLAAKVTGRSFRHDSSELVSDGIDDHARHQEESSPFLVLRGIDSSLEEVVYCEQMYGFLPCSNTLLGHLFLIVVYEYLLIHGESYVAAGGERIFKILGPSVFGASAFQVLGSLPEALILLASGLLDGKESAEEYVLTGVGLLAGSTTFLLTLLWGTCVIIASQDLKDSNPSLTSNPTQTLIHRLLSPFSGSGIITDSETTDTARIMLLSVIPFIVLLVPKIFHVSSSGEHILIIFTLILSILFLLSYFFYQMFQPWIQKRRLEYVKHEHLVVDILKHVQERALGRLLTENGAPNVTVIRSLFQEIDRDGDNCISFSELKELLREIKFRKLHWDKDKTIETVMKEFDLDDDKKINMDEFVDRFSKWLDETKRAMDKRYHSVKSLKDLYQILQPWIQKKRKEHEMKQHLISEIVEHVQSSALGSLFTGDGAPDVSAIKTLFKNIDHDGDNYISEPELKALITEINFGKLPWDEDEAVTKIMEELDVNGDQMINEDEFVSGFQKWLNTSKHHQPPNSPESEDDTHQKRWEETDLLVEDRRTDKSVWAWTKAITLLVLGIIMLAVLAEPLIHSVHNFSTSANMPSFFVAFILVPLATNARVTISAVAAARRKKPRTTSLTFSEIYGGVFMNNVLGFCVLLSLIYFRGLPWHFSAEVLIVLLVCAIVGITASLNTIFPLWTAYVAYLLYPLSLLLVYLLDDFFWFS